MQNKHIHIEYSILILLFFCFNNIYAQDIFTIKVHFLYGSTPKYEYKNSEKRWFGGIKGGHVGIEIDSNKVISFLPVGKLHIFPNKKNKHGHFKIEPVSDFYKELDGSLDSVKKLIIQIPINQDCKYLLDSISQVYVANAPYDYAFLGMRCSSACYDLLGRIGIVNSYSLKKLWYKVFYPKVLRRKILKLAAKNNWIFERFDGTKRRKWERD